VENYRQKFNKEYEKLNLRQKEAVDAIEGPVMVVAGPGTGKTQILTLRIANILLKIDTPPDSILALTFTDSAATNMKRRLTSLIGSRGYYVNISTFHGFCEEIIKNYPEYFPEIIGGKNIDSAAAILLIRNILDENNFIELKPIGDKFFYAKEIISKISFLKKDGISPENYLSFLENEEKKANLPKISAKLIFLRKLRRSFELAKIYRAYQDKIRSAHLYDFDDMILETVLALEKNHELLLELQETYQYILVDEHQDTNRAQNKVVELLGNFYANPNIFVVGDEKQAIYKFQGASLENFLYFKNKYPSAKIITLEENYRSTDAILNAAFSLIKKNKSVLSENLKAKKTGGEKIKILSFNSPSEEIYFIAKDIKKKIAEGKKPKDITVLFRENKEAPPLAEALAELTIPFSIGSNINLFNDPDLKKLISIFEAIGKFGNIEKTIFAMHADFLNIPPLGIYELLEFSRALKKPLLSLASRSEFLKEKEVAGADKISAFAEHLSFWRGKSHNENFLKFFERVAKESGFVTYLLNQKNYPEKINRLSSLFREIKKSISANPTYNLNNFLDFVDLAKENEISISSNSEIISDTVRLLTAHKAKGLEFEIVYLSGAVDRRWGNKYKKEFFLLPTSPFSSPEAEKNEEERRLFFMAITRAKDECFITFHRFREDGKEITPSQFIEEIEETHKETIEFPPNLEPADKFLSSPEIIIKNETEENEKNFLKEIFLRRGLSVTALNNYLECPWKFFYVNLVRLPQAKPPALSFGSAIHRTLRNFFEAKKTTRNPDEKFLTAEFALELKKELLTENDYLRLLEKGKKILPQYFTVYNQSWNYHTKNEIKIENMFFNNIKLSGILDKLELSSNPEEITVVDYKTGAPKSRNEIEGKTSTSRGDYKRQLVFYSIILSGYKIPYRMERGVLDFIEPLSSGHFKKEEFIISGEETKNLSDLIKQVWDEIINFKFWHRRCFDKKCPFCSLRFP